MGHLGKLTSLKDLPPDRVLKAYIKEAMELCDRGVKVERDHTRERQRDHGSGLGW
jgi:hypothetical protein